MSRPGISYSDVESAANQLKEEDRNPTIETVRALLGTGSSSTINMHLRKWKSLQGETQKLASKENLPTELISLMKVLWEQTINQANVRLETQEEAHQEDLASLREEADKYKTNNQRWQQMFNQWQQEKVNLTNSQIQLEQKLQTNQQHSTTLLAKQEVHIKQIEEKQERIDELNRLHKQSQENLEHYREAAREQRLLDQEQFAQQKRELQATAKTMSEKIHLLSEKNNSIQNQNQLLQQSQTNLEKELAKVLVNNEVINQQLIENERVRIESHKQTQATSREEQIKRETQTKLLFDTQVENKVLMQKLTSAKQTIDDTLADKKLLVIEKWGLTQEKARLEDHLEKIQARSSQPEIINA